MYSTQKTETPWEFIRAVEEYFNISFMYDMAATPENAKCPGYFTWKENSLGLSWPVDSYCWLNPPFLRLSVWIEKCYRESFKGSRIFSVWPLSGDLNQITAYKHAQVYIIHGRIWPLVRSVMLCRWDKGLTVPYVSGLRYIDNKLIQVWSTR